MHPPTSLIISLIFIFPHLCRQALMVGTPLNTKSVYSSLRLGVYGLQPYCKNSWCNCWWIFPPKMLWSHPSSTFSVTPERVTPVSLSISHQRMSIEVIKWTPLTTTSESVQCCYFSHCSSLNTCQLRSLFDWGSRHPYSEPILNIFLLKSWWKSESNGPALYVYPCCRG